jgi:hypothetical protein
MKAFLPVIAILLLASCAGNKITTDIQAIRFGSGGGFTGEVKSYALSPQGQLSRIQKEDSTFLKTIPEAQTKEILKSAEAIRDIELHEPDNMYRFIELDYGQAASDRWVWGLSYQNLPAEIDSLYKKLSAITK